MALGAVASAEQGTRRIDVPSLLGGQSLLGTDLPKRFACRLELLLTPDGMTVGHRVSPEGHRAVGIGLAGQLERLVCLFVEEGMKRQHALGEMPLAFLRTGDWKRDFPELTRGSSAEERDD